MGGHDSNLCLFFRFYDPEIGSRLSRGFLGNGSVKSEKDFFLQKGYALLFIRHKRCLHASMSTPSAG